MKTFPDSIPAPPHRRRPVWGICFCGDETSPTSSLRSMPPPLVGEALAFRDVFQQTQISFIENETSLPRAPLPGKTPPAGGGGTQVPKGERLSSECETEGVLYSSNSRSLGKIRSSSAAGSATRRRLWWKMAFSSVLRARRPLPAVRLSSA